MKTKGTIKNEDISQVSLLKLGLICANKLKLIICLICVYAIIFPGNISGDLSTYQYEIIELAFTNGFLKGMSIDDDLINELLKDKEKLNEFTRKAAREYMDTVVALNLTEEEEKGIEKSKKKEPAKANNSIIY